MYGNGAAISMEITVAMHKLILVALLQALSAWFAVVVVSTLRGVCLHRLAAGSRL